MANMKLVVSIINFFKLECEKSTLTDDTRESLEVAIQCLQTAYDLKMEDLSSPEFLTPRSLVDIFNESVRIESQNARQKLSSEILEQAEEFRISGNSLMKAEKHTEAIEAYTKAINLDANNAVYYCNRAAAYSRIMEYHAAIKDCEQAIVLDPKYSKAYGRMGLAYVSIEDNDKAVECYKKAIELDPSNESYRLDLKLAEEKANKGKTSISGNQSVDVNELFNNPVLRNMATTMMQDPNMVNILSGLVSSSMNDGGNGGNMGMDALLQAGQQFAAQMQASNPQLIDQLRQQVLGNPNVGQSDSKDSSG